MKRPKKSDVKERRIDVEILIDAYDSEEKAMGWYYYLNDNIQFPFQAKCITEHKSSPLRVDETVKVLGMAAPDECLHDMLVEIERNEEDPLIVPLEQLTGNSTDDLSQRAIEDWHYWVARGYGF